MQAVGALFLDEPGEDGSLESCSLCDAGGDLVCCDTCPRVFHTRCLNVSRKQLGSKEEEWTCPECRGNWPGEQLWKSDRPYCSLLVRKDGKRFCNRPSLSLGPLLAFLHAQNCWMSFVAESMLLEICK